MLTTVNTWRGVFPVARSYMWDITFPGIGIFPATVMDVEVAQFENDKVNYGPWGFDFPKMAASGNINITAYELNTYKVFYFIREWLKLIADTNWGIGLVGEPNVAKEVTIEGHNITGGNAITHMVRVIPTGNVSYAYNSEKNGVLSPSMSFTVVGDNL